MFQHVLVPLDGSELSEKALTTAAEVLSSNGTLTLVSVVDLSHRQASPLWQTQSHDDDIAVVRKDMRAYLHQIVVTHGFPAGVTVQTRVCAGSPASVIAKLAHALAVDAIVMSTHHRTGLSKWLVGSVMRRVLRSAPCPVVAVPEHKTVRVPVPHQEAVPHPAL